MVRIGGQVGLPTMSVSVGVLASILVRTASAMSVRVCPSSILASATASLAARAASPAALAFLRVSQDCHATTTAAIAPTAAATHSGST